MAKVVKYDPAQYPEAVKNMKHITAVVLVFHPQCGHCVQLRPTWEQMKQQAPPQARFVELNGESMSDSPMMSQSDIGRKTEGFPSIMRVKNGRVIESFQQERTIPNMLGFVKKSMQDLKKKKGTRIGNKKLKRGNKSRKLRR
jgi:thioredoxin-like negative regulator of GroEL